MKKKRTYLTSLKPAVTISMANIFLLLALPFLLFHKYPYTTPAGIHLPNAEWSPGCRLWEGNAYVIFVTRDERVFLNAGGGQYALREMLRQITACYDIAPTESQREQFEQVPLIATDMHHLPGKISFASLQRQPGIPSGDENNQLLDLLTLSRNDRRAIYFLYADKDLSYSFLKKITAAMTENRIYRFNLCVVSEM